MKQLIRYKLVVILFILTFVVIFFDKIKWLYFSEPSSFILIYTFFLIGIQDFMRNKVEFVESKLKFVLSFALLLISILMLLFIINFK